MRFLTRDDNRVILKISTYPWLEKKVWCSKAWSKGEIVQKIVTPAHTLDGDSCEIFINSKSSNVTSYVLRCANIIGDISNIEGMKVIGISKARKWWNDLGEAQKSLRASMLQVSQALSRVEEKNMVEFMDSYERFHSRGINTLSDEIILEEPEEPSKDTEWRGALSFPYEREMVFDSQQQIVLCSQVHSHLREGDTIFELTVEDLQTPTQAPIAQESKGKGKKLVNS